MQKAARSAAAPAAAVMYSYDSVGGQVTVTSQHSALPSSKGPDPIEGSLVTGRIKATGDQNHSGSDV